MTNFMPFSLSSSEIVAQTSNVLSQPWLGLVDGWSWFGG